MRMFRRAPVVVCILAFATVFQSGCGERDDGKPLAYSTIHEAVAKGDLDDVRRHLFRGRAVNEPGPDGVTPLHVAAGFNHIDIAEYLIAKGAEVNPVVGPGGERMTRMSALEVAVTEGHKEMVKLLIARGAKITGFELRAAIEDGRSEIAEELVQKADVRTQNESGETLLHELCGLPASSKGVVQLARILIQRGAKVNVASAGGSSTPLSEAVYRGNTELAQVLIRAGADVNWKGSDGNLLHRVFATGRYGDDTRGLDIVRVLVDSGIDVNFRNQDGDTPLHLVLRNVYDRDFRDPVEAAELLILNGADVNSKDKGGNTPLHLVAESDYFFRGSTSEGVRILGLLIERGGDVNAKNASGKTPLALTGWYPREQYERMLRGPAVVPGTWRATKPEPPRNDEITELLQKHGGKL